MDQKTEYRKEIGYFAAVHFLLTAMTSFWSYSTSYFRDIGFTGTQIGKINAVATFCAMLMLPLTGIISDRIRSPRKAFFVFIACMLPANLILAFSGSWGMPYWFFGLLSTIVITARQPANAMMESWAGGEVTRMGYSYGSIRRWGSFGYICTSIMAACLFDKVIPMWTCLLFSAILAVPLLLLIGGRGGDSYSAPVMQKAKKTGESTLTLLKMVFCNYYFVSYLFLVMAFDLFLGIVNLDMSYLMEHISEPDSSLGIVGSCRACTEVVVMILLSRAKKLPPFWILLTFSGVLIAMEHLLYPAADSLFDMCLITVLCSGLSGGMFYGYGSNYVFQIVNRRAASTAMAVLGVARSLAGVVGSGVGGTIIDRFGVTALTTSVGLTSLALTLFFFAACVIGRAVLKKPYVSEMAQPEKP